MLSATERLRRRLRPSELDLFEPAGQDGRTCQYLAVIHQLELHGVITSFDARELEEAMISWLLDHHDDVVGEPGFHGERGDMAEVAVLRDSWTERDFRAVISGDAQGDHNIAPHPASLRTPSRGKLAASGGLETRAPRLYPVCPVARQAECEELVGGTDDSTSAGPRQQARRPPPGGCERLQP